MCMIYNKSVAVIYDYVGQSNCKMKHQETSVLHFAQRAYTESKVSKKNES